MPYVPTNLALGNATLATWALAWARFFLKDTGTTEMYTDAELAAVLTANAYTVGTTVYFRPHIAVAHLITSDPDRATSESLLGASITTRSPASIAFGVRVGGRWVDDLIEVTAGERPPSGRTLRGAAF